MDGCSQFGSHFQYSRSSSDSLKKKKKSGTFKGRGLNDDTFSEELFLIIVGIKGISAM